MAMVHVGGIELDFVVSNDRAERIFCVDSIDSASDRACRRCHSLGLVDDWNESRNIV